MAANKLPVELWLVVLSLGKFSSNNLAALCQVCTYFHHAVIDTLYESITVDNSDVCTTLAEHPHLAHKVKSFIFTYPTIMDNNGPEVHLDNLTLALNNMTHLSTLKLIHSQKCYSSVLQYCDAKLHIFHCTYAVNLQFLNFLNRQDSICDLVITGRHAHSGSWELNMTIRPSTSIRNLGLDLMVWHPEPRFSYPSIPKHVEEITLTGFATQHLSVYGGFGIWKWGRDLHLMLEGVLNLKG
ncbi:hypothetical protein DFJ58DRAFT_721833 [Suillus subalutaceus]|uniref:uncharacterized protein n=1 Tax=Suillus subalutaceus TaxID=48586 RepID=UPI001B87A5A5|nr:uncharacterized protein DFJ58DRAFT_721833 [Suillus subalutaceus]KAG1873551.1 hypothetical protein DFJ58DRAFT_721833 [Suillus subalutaceus]